MKKTIIKEYNEKGQLIKETITEENGDNKIEYVPFWAPYPQPVYPTWTISTPCDWTVHSGTTGTLYGATASSTNGSKA